MDAANRTDALESVENSSAGQDLPASLRPDQAAAAPAGHAHDRNETAAIAEPTAAVANDRRDACNEGLDVPAGDYSIELAGGDLTVKAEQGRITLEAMQSITLKVGQSSVTIDQSGITIRGLMIDVEGALQTGLKGLRTDLTGVGLLQLGGSLTMIG